MVIDETPTYQHVQQLQITGWTFTKEKQLQRIKLGTLENPQFANINVALLAYCTCVFIKLLKEFKHIFA